MAVVRESNQTMLDDTSQGTEQPTFSIGVTTYNRPEMLKQTLTSILNQTFTDFEVIVGNDYVQQPLTTAGLGIDDPRVRIVNHSKNLGERGNMQALLAMSHGQYFAWQFDDDLYAPAFLEEVFSAINEHEHPDCVFTTYRTIHDEAYPEMTAREPGPRRALSGREFLRQYWAHEIKVMAHAGVFAREYISRVDGVAPLVDGPIALFSEYLLLVQLGLLDRVVYIDVPLVIYRAHDESGSSNMDDLALIEQAGRNLVRQCLPLLAQPALRNDFRPLLTAILKLSVKNYLWAGRGLDPEFDRLDALPYLSELRKQLRVLGWSPLYGQALACWLWISIKQIWWPAAKPALEAAVPKPVFRSGQRIHALLSSNRHII